MAMFLELNGWSLNASEEEAYSAMIAVADGRMSKSQPAGWLKEHTSRSSR
jgi:prophage maintenance system killer protein